MSSIESISSLAREAVVETRDNVIDTKHIAKNASHGWVDIENVSIELGGTLTPFVAVNDVSFSVRPGELVCLLGPSGCGKSTLLSALAGHITPVSGAIKLDGRPVSGPSPERGIVFQQHTLFPWKRVNDNVAFGLKMKAVDRKSRQQQADEYLRLVGLAGFERRFPSQLSGGMQQRVEIARALINLPRVLLMDEPFSALDAQTRLNMQEMLLDIWEKFNITVVFVTHDIDESLFLADRILVMSSRPGRIIEQIHVPFSRPRMRDVMTQPEFVLLKRHCLGLLRDHSL